MALATVPQLIALLFCFSLCLTAQENIRTVQGSGGGTVTGSGHVLRGTFGQNVTGRKFRPDMKNNVGFWYTAFRTLGNVDAGSIVSIPSTEGEIGDTVEIPLMLLGSNKLLPHLPLEFEATIRFNATILFPLDEGTDCGKNEICEIKISGTATDTAGILALMKFEAKLGAVIATDMEIVKFEWKKLNSEVITKNGFFQLQGVCIVDGQVRLIKRTHEAGIFNLYPNPASDVVSLELGYREKGTHTFKLVDQHGNTVREFTSEVGVTGPAKEDLLLEGLSSGSYNLLMFTPNELFFNKLQVIK